MRPRGCSSGCAAAQPRGGGCASVRAGFRPLRSRGARAFDARFGDYHATIAPAIAFLQGRDATLAHRINSRGWLPEGPRFQSLEAYDDGEGGDPLGWAFGALGASDRAKHLDVAALAQHRAALGDRGGVLAIAAVARCRCGQSIGAVPGPRMLVAGNYVTSTGGAGDARQFSIYVDVPVVKNLADGPDEPMPASGWAGISERAPIAKPMAVGQSSARPITKNSTAPTMAMVVYWRRR